MEKNGTGSMTKTFGNRNCGYESNTAGAGLSESTSADDVLRALSGPVNRSGEQFRQAHLSPLHIWQIHDFLVCPVIGTCLSDAEQVSILKKSGCTVKKADAFDIHSQLCRMASADNPAANKIESTLNRKYKNDLRTFFCMPENELLGEWKTRFEDGTYPGLLWSAAVRSDLSEDAVRKIFGDVHMQMHILSEQARQDRRSLSRLDEENRRNTAHIRELKQHCRETTRINRHLKDECAGLGNKIAFVERAYEAFRKNADQVEAARRQAELTQENEALIREISEMVERLSDLQKTCGALAEENRSLRTRRAGERQMPAPHTPVPVPAARCAASKKCVNCSLCNHRVLLVGGMKKFEALYRRTVENCGATFEYHDGYLQSGSRALDTQIKRADLVLCPVNCNSHGACSLTKRLCKKYGKRIQILSNSSVTSIARTLHRMQGPGSEHTVNLH